MMEAVLRSLLEITAYSALIIAAIWVFRRIWGKSLSPAFAYAVWFLLVARLLLPVTVESGLHLESLFPQPQTQVQPQIADTPDAITPEVLAPESMTPETEKSGPMEQGAGDMPIWNQTPQQSQGQGIVEKPQVDWQPWLAGLWLAGIMAHAGWLALGYARFLRQMRAQRCETPQQTRDVLDECKQMLGIKRRIRLATVKGLLSPALMGRTILLPYGMANVRLAILHELTHVKRGDRGVCLLIAALKCVYWFNPLVRWALGQMISDMETACDARVMRHMSHEEKRDYLATIIGLFSAQTLPLPGMAKGRTQKMAQKRIQGAFMRSRTGTGAKAFAFVLAALLLVMGFTTACQRPPDAPVDDIVPDASTDVSMPHVSADALLGVETAAPTQASEPTPEPGPFPNHDGSYGQGNVNNAPSTTVEAMQLQPDPVSGMQRQLVRLGYLDQSDVNGQYDNATRQAVEEFQLENGLASDGIAGVNTVYRLYSVAAKPHTYRTDSVSALVRLARSKEGAPFELNAKGPDAFDCGGFVYWCLQSSGVMLRYMTSAMWAESVYETVGDMKDIQAGDILCFKGHVGIALGDGTMIDASSSNNKVRITRLDTSYWQRNFVCAKRVL